MSDYLVTANFIAIEKVKLDRFQLSTTTYTTGLSLGQLIDLLTA